MCPLPKNFFDILVQKFVFFMNFGSTINDLYCNFVTKFNAMLICMYLGMKGDHS